MKQKNDKIKITQGLCYRYTDCSGWHGTGNHNWLSNASNGFVRGYNGLFSFNVYNWTSNSNYGRGVAVVGTGLF